MGSGRCGGQSIRERRSEVERECRAFFPLEVEKSLASHKWWGTLQMRHRLCSVNGGVTAWRGNGRV